VNAVGVAGESHVNAVIDDQLAAGGASLRPRGAREGKKISRWQRLDAELEEGRAAVEQLLQHEVSRPALQLIRIQDRVNRWQL
jgi:hypothetical protein